MGFYFWSCALHAALAHLQQNKTKIETKNEKRKESDPPPVLSHIYLSFHIRDQTS